MAAAGAWLPGAEEGVDKRKIDDMIEPEDDGSDFGVGALKGFIQDGIDRLRRKSNDDVLREAGSLDMADAALSSASAGRPTPPPGRKDEAGLEDLGDESGMTQQSDIDTLKALTDTNVIEIASGDIEDQVRKEEIRQHTLGKKPGFHYSDIIFALVQIRLPEVEAKRDWNDILRHKYLISKTLGRNVGIHVATLDYYTNIKQSRFRPKILDARDYADTASAAITDPLTKAYNRRFFDEEFRRRFVRARVSGVSFSLLMLDLDHFKMYNDANGHIAGDLALIETVRILHTVCSWRDVVARYGGEEFAVMLHAQPLDQAARTAEKIRKAVYDYRFPNEQVLPGGRLSVSLGVTSYRHDMKEPAEMVEEADVALYRSKAGGRNQVSAFLEEPQAQAQ